MIRRSDYWTEEQLQVLHRMRQRGKSAAEIAAVLGKTRNAVCGQMYRMQGNPNYRPWTEVEIKELMRLRGLMTTQRIAQRLGRTYGSVDRKLQALRKAGWMVADLPPGRRAKPKLPNKPIWEMDEADRRLALWMRAKEAAGEAITNGNSGGALI